MNPLYAFDNYFKNADRAYSNTEIWDHLKSLGFDLAYFSINRSDPASWNTFLEIDHHRKRTGLGLAAVYTIVEFPNIGSGSCPGIKEMIEHLSPGDTLELAISMGWKKDLSDPRHDTEVIAWLQPLVAQAQERQITISLYPHFNFWMERIEDCLRLARAINSPSLRVTFCGYHWYAVDRRELSQKICQAAPWLHLVNLCGSRPLTDNTAPLPASIEPVGSGEFPIQAFLQALQSIRYDGPIGFQGYLIGGNPTQKLSQSRTSYHNALQSLQT